MGIVENLEALLAKGTDSAVLRFSLGTAYRQAGDTERSLEHLARALEHDPEYSAAWKAYASTLADADRREEAVEAYRRGIEVAERKGDVQAAKEMRVFLRRLGKRLDQK